MKFVVYYYDNKEAEVECPDPIQVSHLSAFLKEQLNIDKTKLVRLSNFTGFLSDDHIFKDEGSSDEISLFMCVLDNISNSFVAKTEDCKLKEANSTTDITKDTKEVEKSVDTEVVGEKCDMADLVAKVTGAAEKINVDKNLSSKSLGSMSLGGLEGLLQLLQGDPNNAPPELREQILNLLRGTNMVQDSERESRMSDQSLPYIMVAQPNPELVQQLTDMGFSEERSRKALMHTNNEINAATEMLLTDQDLYLPDINETLNSQRSMQMSQRD